MGVRRGLILSGRCNSRQVLGSRRQVEGAETLGCDVDGASLNKLKYVSKLHTWMYTVKDLQRG